RGPRDGSRPGERPRPDAGRNPSPSRNHRRSRSRTRHSRAEPIAPLTPRGYREKAALLGQHERWTRLNERTLVVARVARLVLALAAPTSRSYITRARSRVRPGSGPSRSVDRPRPRSLF